MKLPTSHACVTKLSGSLLILLGAFFFASLTPQASPAQRTSERVRDKPAVESRQETSKPSDVSLKQDETEEPEIPLPPLQFRPLVIGEKLTVNAKSRGITWQGNTIHLVKVPQLEFELADEQLTAKTKATLLTFDEAPYRAHVAVYDESGALLGTATAGCETQRVWLGIYAMTWRELSFDFGKSKAYANAKFFSVAISDHEIKTPDQWQK